MPLKKRNKMQPKNYTNMKAKKYLTLFLFLLLTTVTFGQGDYQDVVYLKNGSIIRGVIIEQVPNKSIKIETADGNIFVFQIDEIEKIVKERYRRRDRTFSKKGLQSGYKGVVELGYQIGIDYYGEDRVKLDIINGYQINPYFSLALGTGVRYYTWSEDILIPIFADFRINFIDNNISPYLSVGIGYSFDAIDYFEAVGFLLNPTAGISFKVSNKSAMNVGIGYEMQIKEFYYYINDFIYYYYANSGSISIVCSFSF